MITAPPLDPSAEETKAQAVTAEKRCLARFRKFKISNKFDVSRCYASLSPEFGVIVRLDLDEANGLSGATARFMCWTDKDSGDVVTALAVAHKGLKLPATGEGSIV